MFSFNEYLYFACCYLIGSIPFGIIVAKIYGCKDITKHGSGNIGATNVVRVSGKKAGALVFVLDFMKSLIPVSLYMTYSGANDGTLICAFLAVIGHIFPIFNKFKGGKGVATGFGAIMALIPYVFLATVILWLLAFLTTKISSISALFSYAFMPFFFMFFSDNNHVVLFAIALSLLVFSRHIDNIRRLLDGKEKSFRPKLNEE